MKESAARMENIPSTMVLHKHVYGEDTRFSTIEEPLVDNPLEKCLGVIRRGTYQELNEDNRWEYKPVSDLWIYVEPGSDSSDDESSDERRKDHENPDSQ